MAANARILARNLWDTATLSDGNSGSNAWLSSGGLALTNTQQPTERGRTARSTNVSASAIIKATWGSAQSGNMLAATRTNLTTSGTARRQIYSDAAWTTQVEDSTALAPFSTAGLDTGIDVYTEADWRGLRNTAYYFTALRSVQSITNTYADASNADSYIELTRIFFGKYFEFTYNPPQGGLDMTPMDASVAVRADDGSHIVDRKWRARKIVIRLDWIPDATDLASLLAIARYLGKGGECWLDIYPDDTGAKGIYNRGAFRLTDSPTFNTHQYGFHKNTMTFEET